MRFVVDTKVLISGLFWGGTPAEIIHAWAEGSIKVVCSAEIIDEYDRIARRLNPGLNTSQIYRFLFFLIGRSEIVRRIIGSRSFWKTPTITSSSIAPFMPKPI